MNSLPSVIITAEVCMLKIHFNTKVVYVCTDSILNWVFIIGNLIFQKISSYSKIIIYILINMQYSLADR